LVYLRYLEAQAPGRWALLLLLSACLLWTNYFGWALLGCLAIDIALRHRAGQRKVKPALLIPSVALLVVVFIPLLRAFRFELQAPMFKVSQYTLGNAAFCAYSFFVSEAMAPWYWRFSVPASLAVIVCVAITWKFAPQAARRFLYYLAFLFVSMSLLGILNARRLLLIAPWLLLPIGVAIGSNIEKRFIRLALAAALVILTGLGWYGIYSRRYYSAPRFVEPWQQVSGDAADRIHNGATVISNSPSFFFYLTYAMQVPNQTGPWTLVGLLPYQVRDAHVFSPEEWIIAGRPLTPKMLWIRGMNGPYGTAPMDTAGRELDHSCGSRMSRLMTRDTGFEWKQKFFPSLGELPWRIEVRDYDCGPGSSQQVYPIPAQ